MRYRPKTKLFAHQKDALCFLWGHELDHPDSRGGALLMAPRTGKTKTVIDFASAGYLAERIQACVVFAPLGVLSVWQDEIERHCPVSYDVIMWDRKGRKRQPLPRLNGRSSLTFLLINYDAFSFSARTKSGRVSRRSGRLGLKRAVVSWLSATSALGVLDESHRIKRPSGKASRAIVSIGPSFDWRVIATGTAITGRKRAVDAYMQWKFLKPSSPLVLGHTADSFKQEYGYWTNRSGYQQLLAPRNLTRLQQLVHEDSYAISREECFDLPPRLPDQIVHVPLESSAPYYDQMAEEMIAQIESGEVTLAKIKLTQGLRLRQITSGVVKTEPTLDHPEGRLLRIGREKLVYLESILGDQFAADMKIVVPALFRADIAAIAKLGKKLRAKTYVMIGGQKRQERDSAWRTFQRTKGPALIVCQPRTASLGIDLASAYTMIWYSLTTSWVDFSQMEDRIALSNTGCSFMYLLGQGTVDEELYQSLKEDSDFVRKIHKKPELLRRKVLATTN